MFVRICVIIGVFVVIALCGYIKQRKREKRLIEHRAFLVDYRNRFVEYANHGDQEAYQFLNQHMSKAQHYMGTIGILDKLRLPFENVYHVNVPVLSMLSHIASYRDNHLSYNEYARMIDDNACETQPECSPVCSSACQPSSLWPLRSPSHFSLLP